MSKTIRMEEKDSNKITIPPLSIDEEGEEVIVDLNEVAGSEEKAPQEEVAESVDSTIKSIKPTEGLEKGVNRSVEEVLKKFPKLTSPIRMNSST